MPQLKMHGKIPMMPSSNPTDLLSNNFGILPYMLPGAGPGAGPPGVQAIPGTGQLKTAATPGFPFPFPFPFLPANPQALAANFMSFMPSLDSLPAELKEQMKQRLAGKNFTILLKITIRNNLLTSKEMGVGLEHLSSEEELTNI